MEHVEELNKILNIITSPKEIDMKQNYDFVT